MERLMRYKPTSKIVLKNNPEINERKIQNIIAENPQILGLGDLVLKDFERQQPHAGRLDLLLQDNESKTRYEVEIQLGKTDESHIIRTIEYWDIEKKRYPQYEHIAVIVAEDITSRFLNVISLFNGNIPIIAIQMSALKVDDGFTLNFAKVLGLREIGFLDEEENIREITDRAYWEKIGTRETLVMADTILGFILEFDSEYELKYNKHYIGLAKNGVARNFAVMGARKSTLTLELKLEKDEEIDDILNENDLDLLSYNSRWRSYKIRLTKSEVHDKKEVLKTLLKKSYEYFIG